MGLTGSQAAEFLVNPNTSKITICIEDDFDICVYDGRYDDDVDDDEEDDNDNNDDDNKAEE